jgi:hypothetical protein
MFLTCLEKFKTSFSFFSIMAELYELIEPVEVPAFKIKVEGDEWSFPGAKVSTKVNDTLGCSFSGGQMMTATKGNMLCLADLVALHMLAIESIKGNDMSGVDEAAVTSAKQIFYNNLYMTLTGSNPGKDMQHFFGEWTYDALVFGRRAVSPNYVNAKWIKRPKVVAMDGGYRYEEGPNSEVVFCTLPRYAGTVTRLDPRTGAPDQVDRNQQYGSTKFLTELARKILPKEAFNVT